MVSGTARIDVAELRTMLETDQPVMVLDIRKAEDRAEWFIPGSVHVDAYEALAAGSPAALAELAPPAGIPVVTVCRAGKVSLVAAEQLGARGIDARSLIGGMKAWSLAWNTADVPVPMGTAQIIQVRRTGKGCLSYLIGADGEAAVIDPSLAPTVYQDLAAAHGWRIAHVLDTHIHADHLSRSRALTAQTGAVLHLPLTDRVDFPYAPLRDGDVVSIGTARLTALRTPGHTPESTSYLLDGVVLFTGDTLFLTGVGRPDLEAGGGEDARARLLWTSLRRLTALPPSTLVLSGHTSSPVAFDRKPLAAPLGAVAARVAMLRLDERAFVAAILGRIPPAPPNYTAIAAFNEAGEFPPGDPTDLEAGANRCAVS